MAFLELKKEMRINPNYYPKNFDGIYNKERVIIEI